ncbi:solute carrier family 22 member 6-B-like [Tropilaelaps mercedesae]|uniref:Solute carrier family 22 member 6-B-like n=1 Tax=Tropilaelaps mercedesae TaxID=418985 RepID=A0A1V9X9V6_9ACAR|nr:solute carrier family 22 member 6-B-like [Tropilaelaps mercedesae]
MDTATEKSHLKKETTKSDKTVDALFDVISTWHLPLIIFSVVRGFPSAMMLMVAVFTAPEKQNFYCATPPEWIANEGQCTMHQNAANITDEFNITTTISSVIEEPRGVASCSAWIFDHAVYRGTTLVEEWDLVCSRRWMVSTSQSLYIFGLLFSTAIFSHVADWYGRRKACVISLVCSQIIGLLLTWAPSMAFYNAFRFLAAVSSSGYYDAATTLLVECVSARRRYAVTLFAGLGWTSGMVLLPVVSYILPNWRTQHFAIAMLFAFLLALTFFMEESPRWLLEAGRFSDARKVLTKVVRARQKDASVSADLENDFTVEDIDNLIGNIKARGAAIPHKGKGTIADLFGKRFRHSTIVFSYSKMVAYLLWYHVTVSSVAVGLNPYLSFGLTSLCELPNRALDAIIIRTVPRRIAVAISFVVTAGSITVYYGFPESEVPRIS